VIIEILGLGCSNCERLMNNVQRAVDELGIDAQIIKVEDFEMIIRRGITKTPGLVIDGEIRSMGRVPSVEEIKEMIGTVGKEREPHPASDTRVIAPSCGCSGAGAVFYPCSGGSNVGQMSNEVAKSLVDRGLGKFSCLAGVGSHGAGFITAAKNASQVVSLDGCAAKCAYKTLSHAGIEPTLQVVITNLGIEKNLEQLNPSREGINRVVNLVENQL
jgi:small redox-active disulfide protein 2